MLFHSCGVSRFIPRSCSAFPGRNLFRVAFHVFLANGLLLLLQKPLAFERNLGSWPRCCEPFELYSISVLSNHSVNATSWHNVMGDNRTRLELWKI